MTNEIKEKLVEKIEDLNERGYSNEEFNFYLQGMLVGLQMAEAITQDERYYFLDKYSK